MARIAVLLAALFLVACGNSEDVTITQTSAETTAEETTGEDTTTTTTVTEVTETSTTEDDPDDGDGGSTGGVPAGAESCGSGVYVDSATTSCAFGRNVAADYYSSPSNTFESFSPTTGESYEMTCSGPPPIVCTGGNNATVYLTHA